MFQTKPVALLLIGLLLLVSFAPVLAAESEQQQLEGIRRQMQEQQSRVSQAQGEVTTVSDQLRVIQSNLDTVLAEYSVIMTKRVNTEQQIKTNTVILEKAEGNLAERTLILNKRIRDIYKNGQISYLDVLLGATDFRDLSTRIDILERVMAQDIALIAKVRAERELVMEKKAELERDQAAILELEKAAAEKKALIEQSKSEKESFLNKVVTERDTAEQAYQEMLDASKRIEQMIQSHSSTSRESSGSSGALMWPVEGPITSPFGWRTHPIFGTQSYHSGLDIAADYGESVHAADGGVVIYADWMGGYGKAVIIDHGNGITTLYAHNSEILVSNGQRVSKGQTISKIGTTGYSTGPHLHFEVRENGTPVNPYGYLP